MPRRYGFLNAIALASIFIATQALAAASFNTIYNFQPNNLEPESGLVADSAGNLYGVNSPPSTGGAVYELSPAAQPGGTWTYTALFTLNGTSDGNEPLSGLAMDSKGNLGKEAFLKFDLTTFPNGHPNRKIGNLSWTKER